MPQTQRTRQTCEGCRCEVGSKCKGREKWHEALPVGVDRYWCIQVFLYTPTAVYVAQTIEGTGGRDWDASFVVGLSDVDPVTTAGGRTASTSTGLRPCTPVRPSVQPQMRLAGRMILQATATVSN